MKRIALALAALLAMGATPAIAAQNPVGASDHDTSRAAGLIVKYRAGVNHIAPNRQPTGSNFAGVKLSASHGIGDGLYAVSFPNLIADAKAKLYAENLSRDPRVESVRIDHRLFASSFDSKRQGEQQLAELLGLTIRPATAPTKIAVTDGWSALTPSTPKVRVSWAPPRLTYGAKIIGYQVYVSLGAAAFVKQAQTSATARALILSTGLAVGTQVRAYVKAVTQLGKAVRSGLPTATRSALPTTIPDAPELIGYTDDQVTTPSWTAVTGSATGGLPVEYRLTATAPGQPNFVCTTSSTSCRLSNVASGANYKLSLVAVNSRGSSSAAEVVRPGDSFYYLQWYLYSKYGINAPAAWAQLPTPYTNQVVVAVLDTGITSHQDLNDQVVPGYDFVSADMQPNDGDGWDSNANDPGDYTQGENSSWHGTHVAGLIAAAANGRGIVGVAPGVKLQPVRVLGGLGGKESDLYAAITWASGGMVQGVPMNPTPAKVINISMGTTTPTSCDSTVEAAYQAALGRGVTLVTAAGNGDAQGNPMDASLSYPGNCLGSINVGSTGVSGDASYFSNYGLAVDISAPGGDDKVTAGAPAQAGGMIYSDFNSGVTAPDQEGYAKDEGTSMAAPLVAGAAALLYAKNPNLTPTQVWTYLKQGVKRFAPGTACAMSTGTGNQACGAGILDVAKSLSLVK